MIYNLGGWSLGVKKQTGEGRITCENGQARDVKLEATGVGLSVGKSEITGGKGKFSTVESIKDLYGSYVAAEASAAATDAASGQVVTKGEVSLALSGVGKGMELGISIGEFKITPK